MQKWFFWLWGSSVNTGVGQGKRGRILIRKFRIPGTVYLIHWNKYAVSGIRTLQEEIEIVEGGKTMPVNIKHSDHLLLKIEILKAHGIDLSTEKIDDIIRFPDKIEIGYKDRVVAQKRLDDKHVIRVIYEKQGETMLAITVYPGRRTRYEKD